MRKVVIFMILAVMFSLFTGCGPVVVNTDEELSTKQNETPLYESLTEYDADVVLPETVGFSWYKKPFLKSDDIRAIKNCLYSNRIYSYTPNKYGYHSTVYTAYYVEDKCGLINSNGDILCEPIYTDPIYCGEADGVTFNEHCLAFEFSSQTVVDHGGHGGGVDKLYYDINTDTFILINGSEGENEAIDYDKMGAYITYEAHMDIANQYDDYVAYNIDRTGKLGLYNNGKLVIPFEYVAAAEICEDVVAMYDGSMWTYFTVDGDVIMENAQPNSDTIMYYEREYKNAYKEVTVPCVFSYSCGSVPVKKDGKWGYMDKNADMIIDAVFDKALPAFENRAWVCVDGYWGIINI